MKKINIKSLSEICRIPGAPGFEKPIRDHIIQLVEPLTDKVSVDNMGNVIALKKGKSRKKVMVAAHMDEIGFIVTHITDQGYLKFHTLGGFDPKTLTAQRVLVHGKKDLVGVMGAKPIHIMSPEERNKPAKIKDYFIDLGLPAEEVKKLVKVGDPITRERELIEMGNCVNCKSLDNRVSVYILLEALKEAKNLPNDLYAVFTVQEEIGIRGAHVATQSIQPDFGICLDTTIAFDTPGAAAHEKVTELGKGTAIKIMDSRTVCDYRMVEFLKDIATQKKITWQPEILTAGGTDTSALQRMTAGGSIAGAISIPTRNIHQVIEMVNKQDVVDSVNLLVAALKNLDKKDWSH
jgi:endoglucanase